MTHEEQHANEMLSQIYDRVEAIDTTRHINRIYFHAGYSFEELVANLRGIVVTLVEEVGTLDKRLDDVIAWLDTAISEKVTEEFKKQTPSMIETITEAVKDWVSDNLSNQGSDWRDIGVLAYLPNNFPGIDSITKQMGQPWIYPNAFFEDDEYYYIQYMPGEFDASKVKSNLNTFVVWNKSDLSLRSVFWAGFGGTNGLYVEVINGKRYLYSKVNQKQYNLGRFDITDMPNAGAGPVEIPVDVEYSESRIASEFTRYGDSWLVQQNMIPRGWDWDHTTLVSYNTDFTKKTGYYRQSKTAIGMTGTDYETKQLAFHPQALVVKDSNIIHLGGGLWRAGSPVTDYHAFGVVFNGANGELSADYTFSPEVMYNYFVSKGHTVPRIELEGGVVYKNRVHSIVVFNPLGDSAENPGIAVIEFQSKRRDIRGEQTTGNMTYLNKTGFASAYMPRNRDNKLYNAFTGADISNLMELVKYMRDTGQEEVNFSTSTVIMNDFDGTTMSSGYFVQIQNVNNRAFWLRYQHNAQNIEYTRFVEVNPDFTGVVHDNKQNLQTYEGWKELTLSNGAKGEVHYRRFNETVELRFTDFQVTGTQVTVATLPEGYRPYAGTQFQLIQSRDNGGVVAEVSVQNDGDVIFTEPVIGTHAPGNMYRGTLHLTMSSQLNL